MELASHTHTHTTHISQATPSKTALPRAQSVEIKNEFIFYPAFAAIPMGDKIW